MEILIFMPLPTYDVCCTRADIDMLIFIARIIMFAFLVYLCFYQICSEIFIVEHLIRAA